MLTIELPIPKSSNPNGDKDHWRSSAKKRKADRQLAEILAREAMGRTDAPRWPSCKIVAVWTVKNPTHVPDEGNAHARLKGYIDGLEDAGVFVDDKFVTTEIVREVGPKPGVVLHCKPKEPA